ncbi:hypothetical protein C8R45DRAFT_1091300 [Mycena sanguinolenta]|nr:hypothetical protein C8R45DRAFT_1091300 [Mycena sanguinolenta]
MLLEDTTPSREASPALEAEGEEVERPQQSSRPAAEAACLLIFHLLYLSAAAHNTFRDKVLPAHPTSKPALGPLKSRTSDITFHNNLPSSAAASSHAQMPHILAAPSPPLAVHVHHDVTACAPLRNALPAAPPSFVERPSRSPRCSCAFRYFQHFTFPKRHFTFISLSCTFPAPPPLRLFYSPCPCVLPPILRLNSLSSPRYLGPPICWRGRPLLATTFFP